MLAFRAATAARRSAVDRALHLRWHIDVPPREFGGELVEERQTVGIHRARVARLERQHSALPVVAATTGHPAIANGAAVHGAAARYVARELRAFGRTNCARARLLVGGCRAARE